MNHTSGGPPTLIDLLAERSASGRCRYVSYDPRRDRTRELTCRQLDAASTAVAAGLRELSTADDSDRPGVVLAVQEPLSFAVGFFAILRAGGVPVPAPGRPLTHRRHLQRLRSIARSASPALIVTDGDADLLQRALPSYHVVTLSRLARRGDQHPGETFRTTDTDIAYVQYTSGSVADPTPVRLRHHHVLAQLRQAADAFEEGPDSVAVTWVPLHHDMGLVTGVLRPMWSGYTSVFLDAFDFLRDPMRWPRLLSNWRATHTSAPDFGYSLCTWKAVNARDLDLSNLRVARSAGEPVRGTTMRAFADTFAPAGFDYACFTPSYGLAEATLTVTAAPVGRPPTSLWLSTAALRRGGVRPTASGPDATEVVSCGPPLPGTRVEIVDPDTHRLRGERELGEVWIAGPQVAPSPGTIHEIDGQPGHLTGDQGFAHRGELYLLGRGADRFQVAGENYYSTEIEAVVGHADDRLRLGRVAVFLGHRDHWPAPAPVILAECRQTAELDEHASAHLAHTVITSVQERSGLAVRCVWLLEPGALEVTTSGKLQRERCRKAFEDGTVKAFYRHERTER
jgi:acyl-CoA synthetase (AMP-forming)/AMP-acid ligase II